TGTNLSNPSSVTFGTATATATIANFSYDQVTVTIPLTAVTGRISITTADGIATSIDSFTVIKPPTISSFSPSSGAVGTSVTITGLNISSATDVKFNNTSVASPIGVVSPTTIKVIVPPGATTGKISVANRVGTATSVGTFT